MPTNGAFEAQEQEPELEHLLETIPDADGEEATTDADEDGEPILTTIPVVDVHELISKMRRDVEAAFQNELDRLEKAFSGYVGDLEQRIRHADTQLGRLASERERLANENAEHERRWQAIRDLTGGR